MYTLQALTDFLAKYCQHIKEIKVTRLEAWGFNDMEGYQYNINVKVTFLNGRYKLVKVATNSTYLDELAEITPEDLANWLYGFTID